MVAEPIVILSWLLDVLKHLGPIILALMLLIVAAVWVDEKWTWNNGICKRTGKQWKFIKRDQTTGCLVWYGGEGIYQAFYFRQR
ncbi:hypothetical protein D3C71_553440 [compost metagenome]